MNNTQIIRTQTTKTPNPNRQHHSEMSNQQQNPTKVKNPWTCDIMATGPITTKKIRFYWQPGPTNHAYYWTKHHPTSHHKNLRPEFLTPMKTLNTLRKQKLITKNAQKAYLAYTIHTKTNKQMNIREGVHIRSHQD